MALNVGKEIAALQRMTVRELRTRYAEVFGEETRAGNKPWLVKRIAWRIQALVEGDISERARRRAAELANDADVRQSPPKSKATPVASASRTKTTKLTITGDDRLPLLGAIVTRECKGGRSRSRCCHTVSSSRARLTNRSAPSPSGSPGNSATAATSFA